MEHTPTPAKKSVEEKLSQLAAIVESTEDAIVSMDLQGRILSWNQGAETLYGYTAEEMIGQPLSKVIPSQDVEATYRAIQEITTGHIAKRCRFWRIRKNGERFLASATISVLRNKKGEIIGTCGIVRDVSEHHRKEQQIQRLADNLARSNEELKHFAFVASHDLREPLRTIASFAQLLRKRYDDKLDALGHEFIDFIIDGAERMRHLIHSILSFSRLEQFPVPTTPIDVNQLLLQVRKDLKVALEESKSVLQVETLPTVCGDRVQLGQLFQNLISNAIKFRSEASPQISISASESPHAWIFSVSDNGIGVAPEYQRDIFQAFRRLHSRQEYPGTGLGLATCKKIAERHGGSIWLDSVPGKGTTFYFSLPKKPASEEVISLSPPLHIGNSLPNGH